jgi:drug/metabolite transporter (DMT)-like permease
MSLKSGLSDFFILSVTDQVHPALGESPDSPMYPFITLPFGWHSPTARELTAFIALGILGGLAHIFLTVSYRYAAASVVAPFDYTSMLWALLLGYWLFGELPDTLVYVGGTIVAAAGLFVIWRERQLGLQRAREAEGPPQAV